MAIDLTPGRHVQLKANEAEGWPAEGATIIHSTLEVQGTTVLVRVDEPDNDPDDDGLREIMADQIEDAS